VRLWYGVGSGVGMVVGVPFFGGWQCDVRWAVCACMGLVCVLLERRVVRLLVGAFSSIFILWLFVVGEWWRFRYIVLSVVAGVGGFLVEWGCVSVFSCCGCFFCRGLVGWWSVCCVWCVVEFVGFVVCWVGCGVCVVSVGGLGGAWFVWCCWRLWRSAVFSVG